MHPNPLFRRTPEGEMIDFARARGFGILAINAAEGAPLLAQAPFVISPDGTSLDLHLARSNPIARLPHLGAVVLAVNGPDAYISPDWYGLEEQVPTWNYLSVHLRGWLEALPMTALRPHLDALSEEFERRLLPKKPWTTDKMEPEGLERMMRAILPFRLHIEEVQGTWKLGQNKQPEHQLGAAEGVTANPIGHDATEIGRMMAEAARVRQAQV